jgi:hypothetical protein
VKRRADFRAGAHLTMENPGAAALDDEIRIGIRALQDRDWIKNPGAAHTDMNNSAVQKMYFFPYTSQMGE